MAAWKERIDKSCEGMGEGKDDGWYQKEVPEEVVVDEDEVGEGADGWAEFGKHEEILEDVREGEGHDLKKEEGEHESLKE